MRCCNPKVSAGMYIDKIALTTFLILKQQYDECTLTAVIKSGAHAARLFERRHGAVGTADLPATARVSVRGLRTRPAERRGNGCEFDRPNTYPALGVRPPDDVFLGQSCPTKKITDSLSSKPSMTQRGDITAKTIQAVSLIEEACLQALLEAHVPGQVRSGLTTYEITARTGLATWLTFRISAAVVERVLENLHFAGRVECSLGFREGQRWRITDAEASIRRPRTDV